MLPDGARPDRALLYVATLDGLYDDPAGRMVPWVDTGHMAASKSESEDQADEYRLRLGRVAYRTTNAAVGKRWVAFARACIDERLRARRRREAN